MKKEVTLSLIGIFLFLLVLPFVLAAEVLCVTAEVSDISPSSIGIGDEFTIGIHIENCGEKIPQNVSFEILGLPEHISVKEPLVTEIPKIQYSNSERFLVFHMKVDSGAKSGTHIIKTRLSYSSESVEVTKDEEISIDVIGDEAELSIASIKTTPVLPKKGETVELTLRLENFGDGTANAVKIYVEHPFKGIKESFIGTLDSNEDGPAVFTFVPEKAGEFEIPVKISYKDDFGDNEIQTKINLTILRKKTSWLLILFLIAIIGFAIWGFRNYAKLKRTKNKIIHQLLSGETKEETGKTEESWETKEETEKVKSPKKTAETDEEKKKREKKQKRIKEFKEEILKKHKK